MTVSMPSAIKTSAAAANSERIVVVLNFQSTPQTIKIDLSGFNPTAQ